MAFNYRPVGQVQYQPVSPELIKMASRTPFDIAGEAMSKMVTNVDNLAFENKIGQAKDIQGLTGLTPSTPEQQAMLASKAGVFNAIGQEQARADALKTSALQRQATEQAMQKAEFEQRQKQEAANLLEMDRIARGGKTFGLPSDLPPIGVEGIEDSKFTALPKATTTDRIGAEKLIFGISPTLEQEKLRGKSTTRKKGYAAIASPTTGEFRLYDKDAGTWVDGGDVQATKVSRKNPTIDVEGVGEVYIDFQGNPLVNNKGEFLVKKITKQASDIKAEKKFTAFKTQNKLQDFDIATEALTDLDSLIRNQTATQPVTGVLGMMAGYIPESARNDAEGIASTLKAGIGFARLQRMREESKTGGALGSISEKELTALEDSIASLNFKQSPDRLLKNIGIIQREYNNIVLRALAYDKDVGSMIKKIKTEKPQYSDSQIIEFIRFKIGKE